jgi:hypothetical protein
MDDHHLIPTSHAVPAKTTRKRAEYTLTEKLWNLSISKMFFRQKYRYIW